MSTKTETKVGSLKAQKALRRIAKTWPEGYWLFATGTSLHLMREPEPGGARHVGVNGGMNPALIVESFTIPNDGGDW